MIPGGGEELILIFPGKKKLKGRKTEDELRPERSLSSGSKRQYFTASPIYFCERI